MADPINATAILAQAQAQAVQDAAPTDQSLNAGTFLPDEPIPDVLTNEVEADASTIRDALTKLNDEQEVAQESNYNALSYLRDDLLVKHGISQSLAAEAMQLIPNFGKGRPLNYYSKHPSQTGYRMALEEIDQAMAGDVADQLKEQAQMLDAGPADQGEIGFLEKLDFKRRADQVSMQGYILRDFIEKATNNGFNWDDTCFQGCTIDPSQNTSVPLTLSVDRNVAYSFGNMDDYYMTHLQGPTLVELMTSYMAAWKQAFEDQLAAMQAGDVKRAVQLPEATKVTLHGKTVSIEDAYQVFRDNYEAAATAFDNPTTQEWVNKVGNAAEQAKVVDIVVRLKDFYAIRAELMGVLQQAANVLEANPASSGGLQPLVTKFTETLPMMNRNVGELSRFCMNACLATSFAGVLAIKVVEHAWISINQCKDTLQMSEEDYADLKCMVTDIQAPQKTGVL